MRSTVISLLIGSAFVFQAVAQPSDNFTVTSSAFKDGGSIPMSAVFDSMGCTGSNRSPDISWSGAPAGTKSFAVTLYDPDAKTGSGFWHWTVFDIPADVTHLPADAGAADSKTLPKGAVQGHNDFSHPHFDGPCPPAEDPPHRYQLTVYALKVDKLPLDSDASGAMVGNFIQKNMLGKAMITGHSDGKQDHKDHK